MKRTFQTIFMISGFLFIMAGMVQADSIMIAPSEFVIGQPNTSSTQHWFMGYTLYPYSDNTYGHVYAPVDLPQGARVTSVVVFYEDDSAANVHIRLVRRNMYTDVTQYLCDWTTSIDTSGPQSHKISPISYWYINNEGYTYYFWLYFGTVTVSGELQVKGIRVNYIM